jgi:hypothetical protein
MTTALAHQRWDLPDPGTWQTMLSMAEQLVQSGLLPPHVKTPAAAVTIIQKGRELGLPPMVALSRISLINGKPVVDTEVLLAVIQRDHGDNAVQVLETDDQHALVAYKRRGWREYRTHTFTLAEAKRAQLTDKATWRQYPATMLRWRCISALARLGFADSISGVYSAEELGAEVEVDENEEVRIVHPPTPPLHMVEPDEVRPPVSEEEQRRADAATVAPPDDWDETVAHVKADVAKMDSAARKDAWDKAAATAEELGLPVPTLLGMTREQIEAEIVKLTLAVRWRLHVDHATGAAY